LNGMVARYTAIALQWDEVGLQSLADHTVANQDFFMKALKSASRRPRAWRSAIMQMEPGLFFRRT